MGDGLGLKEWTHAGTLDTFYSFKWIYVFIGFSFIQTIAFTCLKQSVATSTTDISHIFWYFTYTLWKWEIVLMSLTKLSITICTLTIKEWQFLNIIYSLILSSVIGLNNNNVLRSWAYLSPSVYYKGALIYIREMIKPHSAVVWAILQEPN